MAKGNRKDTTLCVRMSYDLLTQISEKAERLSISKAAVVKMALDRYLRDAAAADESMTV